MKLSLPSFLRRERVAGFPLHKTREQRLKEQRRKIVLKRWLKLLAVLWIIFSTITTITTGINFINSHELRSPIVEKQAPTPQPIVEPSLIPSPTPEDVEISPEPKQLNLVPKAQAKEVSYLYKGKVSHYSHAGCLGCSEGQVMGNGQPFDENALTLAVPCEDITGGRIRYNTKVLVKNLDNGKSTEATITDCGGFSKYNRIADLSLGMATLLGTKTDQSNVEITLL